MRLRFIWKLFYNLPFFIIGFTLSFFRALPILGVSMISFLPAPLAPNSDVAAVSSAPCVVDSVFRSFFTYRASVFAFR